MKNESIIEKKRYNYIDLLKAIAIFLLIFYHGNLYKYNILVDESKLTYLNYFINTFLSPCVPIFFLVNGFLLFSKELNIKKHILRIAQLIVISFVWGTILLLILQICRKEYFTIKEFFDALFNWKQGWIHYIWFIGALVRLYIFFPILKVTYDNNKSIFNYFVIIVFVLTIGNTLINNVSTVFNCLLMNNNKIFSGFNFFNIFNAFRGITASYSFVYFCLGGVIYNLKDKIIKINPIKRNLISVISMLISSLGLFFVGIVYSKYTSNLWDVVWEGYGTIFTLINTLAIFILCLNYKKDNKIITSISKNTLGIFFIHIIVMEVLKLYVYNLSFASNIWCTFIFANLIMYISLCISLILSKIPILLKLVK